MSRSTLAPFVAAMMVLVAPLPMLAQQRVLLQIRPHVGDTLVVKLDQRVEMTGTVDRSSAATRHMNTVTEVFSRAIVQSASSQGATVLAITDSIRTASARGEKSGVPKRVRGGDNTFQLRVSTDGGADVSGSTASEEVRAVFGQMPATLSRNPVAVGETWKREMHIPIAGEAGKSGLVKATFRLDSLERNGDMAYVSMRGALSREGVDGSDSDLDGSMTGSMQLDRRLGWIVETRAKIDVTSVVRLPAAAEPMRVRTLVTQVLTTRPIR